MKKEFYLVQKFSILLAIVIIGSGFLSCENQFFKEAAGIYEVNFESNGGTKVSTVNTDRIVFSPVTSKNNCEFLGWYETFNFAGNAVSFPYEPKKNTVLYARWNQKYTVHFETNGGTAVSDFIGNEILSAVTPFKEDYTFAGWYLNSDFSGDAVSFPFTLNANITLYAGWNKNHTVTFNANGGTEVSSIKTGVLQEIPFTEKENYEFAGWHENSSLSGEKITVPYTVKQDITLYAKWLPTYLVTLETDGGSEIASFRARTIESVQEPEKSGFTFIEWYLDSGLNNKADFPLIISKDTTLYAAYKKNFTVTFETNGGSEVNTVSSYIVEESPETTKANKSLSGWYLDSECKDENKVTFPFYPTEDVTLFAKWVSEMYTITYDSNGATGGTVPKTVQVEKGSSFVISTNTGNLTKTGYAFTKWSTSTDGESGQTYAPGDSLIPSKNMTLYAQWGKDYAAMVTVPGGSFRMGGTEAYSTPIHNVNLSSFCISQYEVTYELWTEVWSWAKINGFSINNAEKGGSSKDIYSDFEPAMGISWCMAVAWCNAYSKYKGFEPVYYIDSDFKTIYTNSSEYLIGIYWKDSANGYRLPTEAEWEYAASCGSNTKTKYSGTDYSSELKNYAWFNSNSNSETHPVGSLYANSFDIYDMSGNAAEWCFSVRYQYSADSESNPKITYIKPYTYNDAYGDYCVVFRGGSYNTYEESTSYRGYVLQGNYVASTGIRLARNAE